jgi:hypothetical protein
LYQRLSDYEDLDFELAEDRAVIHNPTARQIAGFAIERREPFGSTWDGEAELIHTVDNRFVTVPPLGAGETKTIRFSRESAPSPRIRQPDHKGLRFLDARHYQKTGETSVTVSVCREQCFLLVDIEPGASFGVSVDGGDERRFAAQAVRRETRVVHPISDTAIPANDALDALTVPVEGPSDRFVERVIKIRRA